MQPFGHLASQYLQCSQSSTYLNMGCFFSSSEDAPYPAQLSGGMAKRCALARAFHYQGKLLLMDEPFQGLDYGLRMEMLAMLLNIWRNEQQSILFVTHEIDEALTVASRIAILSARPVRICKIIELPGQEGRDCAEPELTEIRRDVLRMISKTD